MLAGVIIAFLTVLGKPLLYVADASFVPQGSDPNRNNGLASIAGQFGVVLPTTSQALSPDFYAELLKSRVVLAPIVADTFTVAEMGGKRIPFMQLFDIEGPTGDKKTESAMAALRGMETVNVVKPTGAVDLTVATKWRSVSLAIATALINGVTQYDTQKRKGQAAAERKFVEDRLAIAGADLRAAEDRLEQFLRTNREFAGSAELTFQRDRLMRDVGLKQQVFTSLTQSYEEARIREVRDMPVVTIFEPPWASTTPLPRGRAKRVLLGAIVGGLIAAFLAFGSAMLARKRSTGDPEADAFVDELSDLKRSMSERLRRTRRPA